MATIITMHPVGLRYRSASCIPQGRRWELNDYPGYVDEKHEGSDKTYVGYCPECDRNSGVQDLFTPAISWLANHIFGSQVGCANGDTRPRTTAEKRERERRQGFVVDASSGRGERALCIHSGCRWSSAFYTLSSMAAFDAGARHVASAHPDNRIANPGKDTTMRTLANIDRDLTQAGIALERLHERIDRLNAEREARAKLPAEPESDNIAFEVQFQTGGIKYSYGAQRAVDAWFLTGRETGGKTWDEVLDFIAQDVRVQRGTRRLQFRELASGRVVKAAK